MDEEGAVLNVPQRITSRTPPRRKGRTKSELRSKFVEVNFFKYIKLLLQIINIMTILIFFWNLFISL